MMQINITFPVALMLLGGMAVLFFLATPSQPPPQMVTLQHPYVPPSPQQSLQQVDQPATDQTTTTATTPTQAVATPTPAPTPAPAPAPPTLPSPMEAIFEKKDLRIYIYDLPGEMEPTQFKDRPHDMYFFEIVFYRRLVKSELRVTDPAKANLFYIPLMGTSYIHSRSLPFYRLYLYMEQCFAHIRDTLPYFNRSSGMDHMVLLSHDWGGFYVPVAMQHVMVLTPNGNLDPWENQRLRTILPRVGQMNDQWNNRLVAPGFFPFSHIVVPPDAEYPQIRSGEAASNPDKFRAGRKFLLYFRGTVHANLDYSKGIRQYLAKAIINEPDVKFIIGHDSDRQQYFDGLTGAKFCLAVAGWALWSPRMIQAIMCGCIPVLFADYIEHPFEKHIDYDNFTVRMKQKELPNLLTKLRSISEAEIVAKQEAIKNIWHYLVWDLPDELALNRGRDAVDLSLEAVAERMQGELRRRTKRMNDF